MTEAERLADALDGWSGFIGSGYECPAAGQPMLEAAALLRSQAEELERLRRALGEARDTFDKMGKAIAETCPATFAQEIAVCKLSCDEISAALRETKAAPEQEQA